MSVFTDKELAYSAHQRLGQIATVAAQQGVRDQRQLLIAYLQEQRSEPVVERIRIHRPAALDPAVQQY